ncbi:aldo/keto reductase [Streptomyces argyrophylli]|uniref:aldo/keto reductase n=1 Tax=Streptomyces argyrophylli TaxID=2726118 RepID=UPI002017ADBF|nr:aldo/keto reductase [Streptomyces argyrophyllae]
MPSELLPDGSLGGADAQLLNHPRAEPRLTLVACSPAPTPAPTSRCRRTTTPPAPRHPGTPARLAVLREVARETGASVNQVVLPWQTAGELPVIPLVGASSVARLDESLAAVDLELTGEQRARPDAAH